VDLFLSAHAVGVLAFFAAGTSLMLGALSSRFASRREQRQPLVAKLTKQDGWRAVAVGVLRIDGSQCERLEDERPVAASSFHEGVCHGGLRYELAWCRRAQRLRLEVGATSIDLVGPIRIEVGAEEQYPGSPLCSLPQAVRERVCTSTVVSAAVPLLPNHGVFRSLRDFDPVAVVGVVARVVEPDEREPGWRLRPDASGALTVWCRKRPRLRGALGAPTSYGTA
jgi:hypothetical protein